MVVSGPMLTVWLSGSRRARTSRGAVAIWPCLLGEGVALPDTLMELCDHHVSPVDLIAGSAEVLGDRAELGASVEAVSQELSGLPLV